MKSIKTKIIVLTSGISVVIALALLTVFLFAFRNMVDTQIGLLDRTLREDFDRLMKYEVETANSLLLKVDALKTDGTLSSDQAEDLAKKLLRDLRYGKDGYFWADKLDGTNVVLLGNKTEGTNRIDFKDVNGYPVIKNVLENGQKDGGAIPITGFRKRTPATRRSPNADTASYRSLGAGSSGAAPTRMT